MTLKYKRILIILALLLIGFILGRLGVRAYINHIVGGTLFGGDIL